MSAEHIQSALTGFEISVLLIGAFLLLRLVFKAEERTRWLGTNQLPLWAVSPQEFVIYIVLILLSGFFFQAGVQVSLGGIVARSPDRAGWEIVAYGLGFHGGALLGWLLFRAMHASWHTGSGGEPYLPPASPASPLPWRKVFWQAAGSLLASLPVIYLVSLVSLIALRQLGLPDEPQDSIAIFANTKSPAIAAGMFVVACVLAPLNEELLFRAGLYRFCRQKLGRSWALLISGCLFGAAHLNWAGFLPLAALGAILAVVYEATGSIRVAIAVHSLFNLVNIASIVLDGQLPPS